MTVTTITNGANLGGNTSLIGAGAAKTTMQATTTAVVVNVKITTTTEQQNQSDLVRVYYVISPFSVAAGAAVTGLAPSVNSIDCRPAQTGSTDKVFSSQVVVNNGGYLYTWYDSPPLSPGLNVPPTITITSVELP